MPLGRGGTGGIAGGGADFEARLAARFAGREGIGGGGPASSSSIFYLLYTVRAAFMLNGCDVDLPFLTARTRFNST